MTKYTYQAGFLAAVLALTACSTYDEEELNESRQRITAQLSLSVSGKALTRMTVAAAQSDEQFQGMKDITLIPFVKSGSDEDPITAGDRCLGTYSVLDPLNEFQFTATNSRLYDITLPIGINAFLVYGRSQAETNGALTPVWGNYHTDDISFSPVQLVTEVTDIGTSETPVYGAAGAKGNAIINYLNTIFTENWANQESYPILYAYYSMVQNMQAGSSASVQAFVQEIYDALKELPSAAGVSDVLKAILVVNTLPETMPETIALPTDCQGYPADLGLPDGTAVIEWNDMTHKFQAVTDKNNLGAMNVDVKNFVKPAELWYRTNSRINTDYETRQPDYESQTTWPGVLNTYAEQNGSVTGNTKSVAVRQQMQYAVGRLDVKLAAGTTTLKDNADTPNDIPVSDLAITGILVGQQSPVDFLFQSKGGDGYTIYDSEVADDAKAINAQQPTHTLVLETQKDQQVIVAVELQNNSTTAFVTGEGKQLVPPGCKFYLVGQMAIKTGNETDGYTYISGYDANVDSKNRVFCQDYVTEVTFTVNDLTNAYYIIPPLTSAQLEFSLGIKDWKMCTPSSVVME